MWSYINVILKIRILCSEFIRPTGYIEPCIFYIFTKSLGIVRIIIIFVSHNF